MNKRIILIGIVLLVIALIGGLWYWSSSRKSIDATSNTVVNQNSALLKVSKSFDLNKSFVVFSNTNAKLEYQASSKKFTLHLEQAITSPIYNSTKATEVELMAASELKLTAEEACLLPIQIVDFKNESITSAVCSGEE